MTPFTPRPVRFLGVWSPPAAPSWRIKVYSIAHAKALADAALVEAAKSWAGRLLVAGVTARRHEHAGFLGVHDGRGANQAFLDIWIEEHELLHRIATSPKDDPTRLTDRTGERDDNSVCVWDLAVQWREREAWVAEVLVRGGGPGAIEADLARAWEGEA